MVARIDSKEKPVKRRWQKGSDDEKKKGRAMIRGKESSDYACDEQEGW